jgi:hypothetical protein
VPANADLSNKIDCESLRFFWACQSFNEIGTKDSRVPDASQIFLESFRIPDFNDRYKKIRAKAIREVL